MCIIRACFQRLGILVVMRKKIQVSILIALRNVDNSGFEMWTQTRLEEGPLYGKHEFPGGKIEVGETPLDAVIREFHEEVGLNIENKRDELKLFKLHQYLTEHKEITLYVFMVKLNLDLLDLGIWYRVDYQAKSQYLKGKIPEINHDIIDDLALYLEKNFSYIGF